MMKIVATNIVASRSPERRPTATPTARANYKLLLHKEKQLRMNSKMQKQWNGVI